MATRSAYLNRLSRNLEPRSSTTDHSSNSPVGASSGGRSSSGQTPCRRQLQPLARSSPVTVAENRRSCDVPQGGSSVDITIAIEDIQEQQKQLQETSTKIVEMIKGLREDHEEGEGLSVTKRRKLPKEISSTVHEVYCQLKEGEDEMNWDFTVSFDDRANKNMNVIMVRNVKGVHKDADFAIIKRAVQTYFKSLKVSIKERLLGNTRIMQLNVIKDKRHNKAHARARVLNQSTTIDDSTKKKVLPVLRAEFMSSEESLLEDTNSESAHSDNSEDHEQPHSNGQKRLMRHKLPWRSQEMQKIIESLDRKLERRRTPRGKAMCLKVVDGKESARPPPENLPEWARELFS